MTKLTAISALHGEEPALSTPKLGRFTAKVGEGEWVTPGQTLGWLWVLHQRYTVVAPEDASGIVAHLMASHREHPVEYGAPLLVLQPATAQGVAAASLKPRSSTDAALLSDLPAGSELFRAPMDGQFYQRSSPDAPPFAEAGQTIEPGQTVGLIEVMKFFYPIRNEGKAARHVERVLVGDAVPVHAGQPLIIWR